MGLFDKIKSLVSQNMNRYSGQKDFLEAVCAGAALVANADGDISDAEIATATKTVAANATLSASFDNRSIETTMQTMMTRATGGRVGKAGLMSEITDVANDPDKAEAVLLSVLDVAESDGNISEVELAVCKSIATALKVDINKYL